MTRAGGNEDSRVHRLFCGKTISCNGREPAGRVVRHVTVVLDGDERPGFKSLANTNVRAVQVARTCFQAAQHSALTLGQVDRAHLTHR